MPIPDTPLPDWLDIPDSEVNRYITLMMSTHKSNISILFKLSNLLFYVFIGAIFSEYFVGETFEGAIIVAATTVIITLMNVLLFYKLRQHGLSLKVLGKLFSELPRLSKIFVAFGVGMVLTLTASTLYTISLEELTFVTLMYTSVPLLIVLYNIILIYPVSLLRRHLLKKKVNAKKGNTSATNTKTVHTSGNIRMVDVENEEEPSDTESVQPMGQPIRTHPIIEQIISQKDSPLALNSEELGILEEHDLVEDYFDRVEQSSQ